MRKGTVVIVCRDREQISTLFDYICEYLGDKATQRFKNKYNDSFIVVNEYRLVFRTNYLDCCRGFRPEIVYIDTLAKVTIQDMECVIMAKTSYSNRHTPIRYGELEQGIVDLRELIDDEYARNITCDEGMLKYWEDKFGV